MFFDDAKKVSLGGKSRKHDRQGEREVLTPTGAAGRAQTMKTKVAHKCARRGEQEDRVRARRPTSTDAAL